MLNLPKDAQEGLRKLSYDLTHNFNKEKLQSKQSFVDLFRLTLGIGLSTVVLYCGLVMLVDYTLLLKNLAQIIILLVACTVGLGLLGGK